MRSSVVPLVPRSVQKASRGRVVTVITRMLVISSSPTERGSLYRLIYLVPAPAYAEDRVRHGCRHRAAAIASLRPTAGSIPDPVLARLIRETTPERLASVV